MKGGMLIRIFKVPDKIYKDKSIKPEGKIIYEYIYSKGFDRIIVDINVGELQQKLKITNKGLRKNLEKLELGKYLIFKEYDTGMYQIHLQNC